MFPVMYKVIMMFLVVCLILDNTYSSDTEYDDPDTKCIKEIAKFFNLNYSLRNKGNRGDMTKEKCFEKGIYELKKSKTMSGDGSRYYINFNSVWNPEKMKPKQVFCESESDREASSNHLSPKTGDREASLNHLSPKTETENGETSSSDSTVETEITKSETSFSHSTLETEITKSDREASSNHLSPKTETENGEMSSSHSTLETEITKKCLNDLANIPATTGDALYHVFYEINLNDFTKENVYGPKYMKHIIESAEFYEDLFHPDGYCRSIASESSDESEDPNEEPVAYDPKYNTEWLLSELS